MVVKEIVLGPCVRLRCEHCDRVVGVIAPTGDHAITTAFNRNLGAALWRQMRQEIEIVGENFVADDPEDHGDPWALPAVLEAWCPQCHQQRTMSRDDVLGPTARVRRVGEGEDVPRFR